MYLKDVLEGSVVNGDGTRIVVVFSGCTLDCKGCFTKELRHFTYGKKVDPLGLAHALMKQIADGGKLIEGMTLSGGNPPEQPDILIFLKELRRIAPHLNLWMWSGFTKKEMDLLYTDILQYIDVMVTGRFVEELKCDHEYYGSSNQEVWRKQGGEWIKDDV